MLKSVKIFCIFILLGCIFSNAYAMDAIEQTYYEQLKNINEDIIMHRLQIDYHHKLLDIELKYGVMDSPLQQRLIAGEDEKIMRRLKQKRLELRLQVLEKYGKLPDWWKEPD